MYYINNHLYPGEGNGNPFQYFCLGNSMDRGASWLPSTGRKRIRHTLLTKQSSVCVCVCVCVCVYARMRVSMWVRACACFLLLTVHSKCWTFPWIQNMCIQLFIGRQIRFKTLHGKKIIFMSVHPDLLFTSPYYKMWSSGYSQSHLDNKFIYLLSIFPTLRYKLLGRRNCTCHFNT